MSESAHSDVRDSLTASQRRAAKYLALGVKISRAAEMARVSRQMVDWWTKNHAGFQKAVELYAEEGTLLLEEMLLEGERRAASAILEALEAKEDDGKNWDVRLKAAFRLLDAMGRRGRPVEKVEQETKTLELKGDLNEMLKNALRDPGVQAYLRDNRLFPRVEDVELVPLPATSGELVNYEAYGPDEAVGDSGASEAGPGEVLLVQGETTGVLLGSTGSDPLGEAEGVPPAGPEEQEGRVS